MRLYDWIYESTQILFDPASTDWTAGSPPSPTKRRISSFDPDAILSFILSFANRAWGEIWSVEDEIFSMTIYHNLSSIELLHSFPFFNGFFISSSSSSSSSLFVWILIEHEEKLASVNDAQHWESVARREESCHRGEEDCTAKERARGREKGRGC